MLKYTLNIVLIIICFSCDEYSPIEPVETPALKSETKYKSENSETNIMYVKRFDRSGKLTTLTTYRDRAIYSESEFSYDDNIKTQKVKYLSNDEEKVITLSELDNYTTSEQVADDEGNILTESITVYDDNGNIIKIESTDNGFTTTREFEYRASNSGQISSIYIKENDRVFLSDTIIYSLNEVKRISFDQNGSIQKEITTEYSNNLKVKEIELDKNTNIIIEYFYHYTFY